MTAGSDKADTGRFGGALCKLCVEMPIVGLIAVRLRLEEAVSLDSGVEAMMTRRILLGGGFGAIAASRWPKASAASLNTHFEIEKPDAEWHKELTPEQYEVLREQGTERPGSSPLLNEHRQGTFVCAGCDQAVFSSETKYESGTGWPSFWAPIRGAIETSEDYSHFMIRVEVHCARCGGHLGHVFDDGPPPTGKRYCMNGIAMKFQPAAA
jgi:peptide-methionine (R)-S-oxide reductase